MVYLTTCIPQVIVTLNFDLKVAFSNKNLPLLPIGFLCLQETFLLGILYHHWAAVVFLLARGSLGKETLEKLR